MKKETRKPQYNMWQCVGFMLKLAWTKKEKKAIILSIFVAVLTVAQNLVNLYIAPVILQAVESQVSLLELVTTIFTCVSGLVMVTALLAYVNENKIYGRMSVRTEITDLINKKTARTSYPNLFDEGFNKVLNIAQSAMDSNWAASERIWETMTLLLTNVLGFIFYVGILSNIQPIMMIVVLVTTILSYFATKHLQEYGYRYKDEIAKQEHKLDYTHRTLRDISGGKDIRIFGVGNWFEDIHEKAMAAYLAAIGKEKSFRFWGKVIDLILAFLRNGLAYWYFITLVVNGEIQVAQFLLYFSAIGGFSAWISGSLQELNTLQRQSMDISAIIEVIRYPEPFKFEEGEDLVVEEEKTYEISLENVSFRYPGAEQDILSNIAVTLHPGEKLAVVGLNGAGKTTLIKLICGFLDPTEGRVLLDGKDIRDYNRRDYYKMFSAVFQEFSIVPESLAVNVAQNNVEYDLEKVKGTLAQAGLKEKIESLEEGYDTKLGKDIYPDAVELSGGETQRLMLARALYKGGPIIVLDEPTAALDPIAESEMYEKYHEMTAGKSSIYISHRLASTRFCDRIIMIADGRICEEGSHEALMRKNGEYAKLFEVQSKYYKEGGEEDGK